VRSFLLVLCPRMWDLHAASQSCTKPTEMLYISHKYGMMTVSLKEKGLYAL